VTSSLTRAQVIPEPSLPDGREVLAEGAALAKNWRVGQSAFLDYYRVPDEASYKRQCMNEGRIMQHAHMGFRDRAKSERAFASIHESVASRGGRVDRFGLCLDWSMGFERSERDQRMKGTGLILSGPEEFAAVANAAPVATHFGDFMLGFPAALENTCFALAAGSTVIGNLGQYFTFRLPDWQDDLATTRATLAAIGLMAAQPVTVMVHSNLDDGFAAVFEDLASALGAALLEKHIVEDLAGGVITHCFGHHYSTPGLRLGFQRALARINPNPGSMIYGNTTVYRGNAAENYASLGSYLALDIIAQETLPSGHAINPVPVTENERIPEIEEIIDAQSFANRQSDLVAGYTEIIDFSQIDSVADQLVKAAQGFFKDVMTGLGQAGFNTQDAFEMLLAIRRIGGRRLEELFGQGSLEAGASRRTPLVRSDTVRELDALVAKHLANVDSHSRAVIRGSELVVLTASTDVHEHGKRLIEGILCSLGVELVDGGVSAQPEDLGQLAERSHCNLIALSTYNGVALTFQARLSDELRERGVNVPILMGGQLNEIPDDSPDSLPVDVSDQLAEKGVMTCRSIADMAPYLIGIIRDRPEAAGPGLT
jgi:methylmalonyl-CoA mutase cobalamin-binding subunit